MRRKDKKKAEEQSQPQVSTEQNPEPAPPAPDPKQIPATVPPPSQEQPTVDVAATPPEPEAATPLDDELPPPPTDTKESAKAFPPIKTRKPGVGAALKRAGAIFGKDARTIAKHGLVSSVILLVFLMVIFYISSYAMFMFVSTGFGEKNNGGNGNNTGSDNGPNLGNDGSLIANAGSDRTVTAGTLVTLNSSATVHKAALMYVQWSIEQQGSGGDSQSLFGPEVTYRFNEVGVFTVNLMVVDAKWNADSTNMTITVNPNGPRSTPVIVVNSTGKNNLTFGNPINFSAWNSTGGVVNWTWTFHDVIDATLYGANVSYRFNSTGDHQMSLVVRDAAGNTARQDGSINVMPSGPGGNQPNANIANLPQTVRIGDTVTLDASQSGPSMGNLDYVWYVKLNDTMTKLTGSKTSFVASGFGMYDITLMVRDDNSGNAATSETSVLSLTQDMKAPSVVSWTSTPLGQDIPFDVLTFAYGASLLASVIFLGGLFAKGFSHEIQKGTAKTLFFAPLSVTNMIFAKLLYPLIIAPFFIFPLLMISLMPLQQDPMQILEIAAVSYVITALVLISGAYGSCMIYLATKSMSVKPTVVARSFMYVSLVGTLSVFSGFAYLLDHWFSTDSWNKMYEQLGPTIAKFSPFHQGALVLKNLLFGAPLNLDWMVFIIPAILIVGGILASRRLYSDIFSRE